MKRFIIKVHVKGELMYWTLNGSTVHREAAYRFTEGNVPEMFKSSLKAPYIEKEYV